MRNLTFYFLLSSFFIVVAFIASQLMFRINPVVVGKYFLAQIGITAIVPQNPINTLARELQEKELKLEKKEKELAQQELLLQELARQDTQSERKSLFYLFLAGGILLILILFNFYRDYKHEKNISEVSEVQPPKVGG